MSTLPPSPLGTPAVSDAPDAVERRLARLRDRLDATMAGVDVAPRVLAALPPRTGRAEEHGRGGRPRAFPSRPRPLWDRPPALAGRVVRVALAAGALLALTAGAAAAPELRDRMRSVAVAIGGGDVRITSLYPAPAFAVFQPTALPAGLRLVAQAYAPATAGNPPQRGWLVSSVRTEGGSTADSRIRLLLGDTGGGAVITIYADPDAGGAGGARVVELVQRPDAGSPAEREGERIGLRGTAALYYRDEGRSVIGRERRDVLTWLEAGTRLELHTTLGRDEALRVAGGLERTTLAQVPTPPPPPAVTEVPLRQRVTAVETTRLDPEAAAVRCGPWGSAPPGREGLGGVDPQGAYGQAVCVARVVAGVGEDASSSLSRIPWREAVARVGVDPASGPPGDPEVWLAVFGGAAHDRQEGAAVVLDVTTGRPYLLARLAPVPARRP